MLGEFNENGRRYASTSCKCGRKKDVLVDSLLSGRTTSCGIGACKSYKRVGKDPDYVPSRPRVLTVAQISSAWNRYHHVKPTMRRTVPEIADKLGVSANTLHSAFRAVRRTGGIKAYERALK